MILTNTQVRELYSAHVELNGQPKVVNEQAVLTPYKLTGKTRLSIINNLGILKKHLTELESSTENAFKLVTGGKTSMEQSEDPAKFKEVQDLITNINKTEVNINGLKVLTTDELDLDKNPIPSTAVVVLLTIKADQKEEDDKE